MQAGEITINILVLLIVSGHDEVLRDLVAQHPPVEYEYASTLKFIKRLRQ